MCLVLQRVLLQADQDLSPGSAQDGDALEVWWQPRGEGVGLLILTFI